MKYLLFILMLIGCGDIADPVNDLVRVPESVLCGWKDGGLITLSGIDDGQCYLLTPEENTAFTNHNNACQITAEDQQPRLVKLGSTWKMWSKTGSIPSTSKFDTINYFKCN